VNIGKRIGEVPFEKPLEAAPLFTSPLKLPEPVPIRRGEPEKEKAA
jgi:hypothetical protein